MKITHVKITASSNVSLKVPAPFNKYYDVVSDAEIDEYTGYTPEPGELSPCEDCEGYDVKHLSWVLAKPEYRDDFANSGIDAIELVSEGGDTMLAYVVGDRIYALEQDDIDMAISSDTIQSSSDTAIYGDDDGDEGRQAFADDPVAGIATMLGISYDDAEDIFDTYDAKGATADYDDIGEFLDFVNDDIRDSLDGSSSVIGELNDSLKASISKGIEGCDQVSVNSAVNTGLEYWYFSRHGMGPGTIPKGVQVEDWYEEGYKTWMKLDKMLTTAELNDYELKEQTPPEGVTTHNGDVIEGCSTVNAAECVKVSEDDDSISYVVSDTEADDQPVEASEDFVVDYKIPDDPEFVKNEERKRKARELADEEDAYDYEHSEGIYAADDIENDNPYDLDQFDLMDPDDNPFNKDEDDSMPEETTLTIPVDITINVQPDTSWSAEDYSFLDSYVNEYFEKDDLIEDFEYIFVWTTPDAPGRYDVEATVTLAYKKVPGLYDNYYYQLVPDKSSVHTIDIQPAGRDFDEPVDEVIEESTNIEASSSSMLLDDADVQAQFGKSIWDMTPQEIADNGLEDLWSKLAEEEADVEGSTVINASMTEEELDDAILEGKPFDLASFKKYKDPTPEENLVRADEIAVGDVIIVTEDASEVTLGTRVEILSINDPKDDWWEDYTFHVCLLDSPEGYKYNYAQRDPYSQTTLQPGDEVNLHFSADEYVGIRENEEVK